MERSETLAIGGDSRKCEIQMAEDSALCAYVVHNGQHMHSGALNANLAAAAYYSSLCVLISKVEKESNF